MKSCSKQGGKRYSCPECPYVVDRQDRLKTHQEKKHTKKTANSFKCTYCQKIWPGMSERTHKFKVTRKIGTPVHKELALKSRVWQN